MTECRQGKYGCKYGGDLYETCPKYSLGFAQNGEPIFATKAFPCYCKDCADRDFDFCLRWIDLICFDEQDPFNCKADLKNDKIEAEEIIEKRIQAQRKACLKRHLSFRDPNQVE